MRRTPNRLRKKYFKCVANGLNTGKVSIFHIHKLRQELGRMYDRTYTTKFRPWWYDQIEHWTEMNYVTEFNRFLAVTEKEIVSLGIDLGKFEELVKKLPKRPERNRKPRKIKEVPVRKLKKPEQFYIRAHHDQKQLVTGEKAFNYKGYDFFIRYEHRSWIVSDVTIGAKIAFSDRYKKAISIAKDRIERNFDEYLELIKKHAL